MEDHEVIESLVTYFRSCSMDSGRTILANVVRRSAGNVETSSSIFIQTFEERLVVLRDLSQNIRFERFPGAGKDLSEAEIEQAVTHISEQISQLSPDNIVDFLAQLTVEWARRCNLEDVNPFDPDPNGPGYHLPVSMSRDEWLTQFLIWTVTEEI